MAVLASAGERHFGGFGLENQFKNEFSFDPSTKPEEIEGSIAQALILMNDEFMELESREWAKRLARDESDPRRRVTRMYEEAFARPPEDWEITEAVEFVRSGAWGKR